jgi:N-acyl-D-aspartate/D-glutamate deacylase
VGYATLRRGIVGDEIRALEKPELEAIKKILAQSFAAGAFGLSSGLSYAHEIIISQIELFELAKVVNQNKGLFSVHLRSEGAEVIESVEEVLEIARTCDVNLKISHLKIRGQENWQSHKHLLELLETAYHKGLKVHYDIYPYDTTWQPLYSYLPKWAIEGGRVLMLKHFSDATLRNKILAYLNSTQTKWPDMFIASTGNKLQFLGKTIGQVAKNLEMSSEAAVLHILEHAGSEVLVFDKNLDQKIVDDLLAHPLGFIATDGGGFSQGQKDKLVHPRCFGTTARFLKQILESKIIPLEQAIFKLSAGPAQKLGLVNHGLLHIGYKADMVLFDPKKILDRATYENPYQFSEGLDYVFVNGVAAVAEGKLTRENNGRVLRKK